jgi:hypothetical protein
LVVVEVHLVVVVLVVEEDNFNLKK